eukprot:TRINITY_DN606_c0_g1_i2.p1 TRINITY_DN606_c0_g1~~TRINITY_DN606_c0_g1_i2.p1  ORF type:complete len:130 (-),score=29.73 TRINITY_DN606_c0_g1_i2:112-501(-)
MAFDKRRPICGLLCRPLAAMQTLSNVQEVMVCRECMAFVGTTRMQLELLRGRGRMQCLEAALHAQAQGTATAEEVHHCARLKTSCWELPAFVSAWCVLPPRLQEGFLSDIVPCAGNCGEVYCTPKSVQI